MCEFNKPDSDSLLLGRQKSAWISSIDRNWKATLLWFPLTFQVVAKQLKGVEKKLCRNSIMPYGGHAIQWNDICTLNKGLAWIHFTAFSQVYHRTYFSIHSFCICKVNSPWINTHTHSHSHTVTLSLSHTHSRRRQTHFIAPLLHCSKILLFFFSWIFFLSHEPQNNFNWTHTQSAILMMATENYVQKHLHTRTRTHKNGITKKKTPKYLWGCEIVF